MPKKKEKVVMLPRPPSPSLLDREHNPSSGTTVRISDTTRSRLIARSTRMDQTYDYIINELLDEVELNLKTEGPEAVRIIKEAAAIAKKGRQK
jgi:hypothetical protein